MRELFELVNFLREVGSLVGEFVSEDTVDLSEGGFEVDCRSIGAIKVEGSDVPHGLWGLDSHSRVMRLEGVDVHIFSGALVGSRVLPIPGIPNVKWIAVRFRFSVGGDVINGRFSEFSRLFYIKSSFIDRVFDGSFSETVLQDEVRVYTEDRLMEAGDWGGILLIDGPIFLTPKVISMPDNSYSTLYLGLIKDRVSAIRSRRVIGVTKRISNSRYLRSCSISGGNVDIDDDTLARRLARGLGDAVAIGPIHIRVGEFEKSCWYLVVRLGGSTHVIRVEGLDEGLVEDAINWIPRVIGPDGVPTPIYVADKLSRRLSAAAYNLLWRMSPLGLTYEGIEELERVMSELGGA